MEISLGGVEGVGKHAFEIQPHCVVLDTKVYRNVCLCELISVWHRAIWTLLLEQNKG